ncbi:MAG: hypothetical protein R3F62_23680 [Planctomycetota bacterium]
MAGVAAALTASSAWVCALPLAWPLVALAGLATAAVYGADRLFDAAPADAANVPARAAWVAAHRRLLGVQVLLASAGTAALALTLPLRTQLALLVLGGCTGLYGLRLVPVLRRFLTPIKPLTIGALWAGGSVWIPHVQAGLPLGLDDGAVLAARALHVVCGCLLFDLRDLAGDAASGERTWAARWGRRGTLGVCWGLVGAAAALLVLGLGREAPQRALPDLVTSAAFAALLVRPRVDLRRYCALGVDGALGLPGLVAWLLSGP